MRSSFQVHSATHVMRAVSVLFVLSTAGGCKTSEVPTAFGNFEADEVTVSAETSGPLERFVLREGMRVDSGSIVAEIDTIPLALEREQLEAQGRTIAVQRQELRQQTESLDIQREVALRTQARTARLFSVGASTAMQHDISERDARVLGVQVAASQTAVARLDAESQTLAVRIKTIEDRLRRARVHNPLPGTVLATFVQAGEIIQGGQPLYRIANLDTLILRAYISAGQLTDVTLGQQVRVTVSGTSSPTTRDGVVSWIADRAEFTPTPVQTRDDRASLVYAVKVRVPNTDGLLKIGMPADFMIASLALSGRAP